MRHVINTIDPGEILPVAGDIYKFVVRSTTQDLKVRSSNGDVFPVRSGVTVTLNALSKGLDIYNVGDAPADIDFIVMAGVGAEYEASAGAVEVTNFPVEQPVSVNNFPGSNGVDVKVTALNLADWDQSGAQPTNPDGSSVFHGYIPANPNRKSLTIYAVELVGGGTGKALIGKLSDYPYPFTGPVTDQVGTSMDHFNFGQGNWMILDKSNGAHGVKIDTTEALFFRNATYNNAPVCEIRVIEEIYV